MPPVPREGALSDDARLTSVAYIGPKSRTERPRKIKIGTEVAHVTRDSDTTFNVKMSKVNLHGAGEYCGGLPHSLFLHKTRYAALYCNCCNDWARNFSSLFTLEQRGSWAIIH